jgi:hypothetical protein
VSELIRLWFAKNEKKLCSANEGVGGGKGGNIPNERMQTDGWGRGESKIPGCGCGCVLPVSVLWTHPPKKSSRVRVPETTCNSGRYQAEFTKVDL